MHQPSRLFQHGACKASRCIGSTPRTGIDIPAQDTRPSLARARPYFTAIALRRSNLHQTCHERCKYGNSTGLAYSNSTLPYLGSRQSSTYQICSRLDPTENDHESPSTKLELNQAERDASSGKHVDWGSVVQRMDKICGAKGVCATMNRLKERKILDVVISSARLRAAFVSAAIQLPTHLSDLFSCAEVLLQQNRYRWPDLYTKTIHSLLEKHAFKDAIQAHLRLNFTFIPEQQVLGMLFKQFITESDPKMQNTLKTIYVSLAQHNLYDVIIPALFISGQSNLARNWRKTLLLHSDFPSSESSAPFLSFLTRYYTNLQLTPEEATLVNAKLRADTLPANIRAPEMTSDARIETVAESPRVKTDRTKNPVQSHQENRTLTEGIVTKLFASSWTPVDFAIRLARNAGVNSIGPRALQALALRENSASAVSKMIKELHELKISIPINAYGTAISVFAEQGKDALLHDLLHSDIHPEEFDDKETREMILQNSVMRQDSKQERLMRGVLKAINTDLSRFVQPASCSHPASTIAFPLEKINMDRPWQMKLAVDRMLSLGFRMRQADASTILRKAFATFPVNGGGIIWKSDECIVLLDEIIGVVRSLATQDVAIPVEYWKVLLLGLGHQGKFDTLEQFSIEIVQMYDSSFEGLYPVHETDLPENPGRRSSSPRVVENHHFPDKAVAYIPADLPFRHPDHPIRKIFDGTFQRAAVRLGFQWALDILPVSMSGISVQNPAAAKFNVACGVRLLAKLRDRGVYIDQDSVKSGARNGIQFSMRVKECDGDTRGKNWLSTAQMKTLVDLAWGSVLLSVEDIDGARKSNCRSLPIDEDEDWFRTEKRRETII